MEQVYTPKQGYKVLVRCMTYNQSKYIEDTLNGFVMQHTNFPFVCLVMEDCSTDGEQEVIKAWMERECDIAKAEYIELELSNIIIVPHKSNTNCTFAFYLLKRNLWKEGYLKSKMINPWREHSVYEATCEGDDYWIHPQKLQLQVDKLDSDSSVFYCFSGRLVLNEKTRECKELTYPKSNISTHDLLAGFIPGLQNSVYRTTVIEHFNPIAGINGDRRLPLEASYLGKVVSIKDVTCVYRNTGDGVSTRFSKEQFFAYAVRDVFMFHKLLGFPSITAYCKCQSENIGRFYTNNKSNVARLFEAYKEMKKHDDRVNIFLYLIMIGYKILSVIDRLLGNEIVKVKYVNYDEYLNNIGK